MNLPEQYENRMRRLLGGEYEAYEKSMQEKRTFGLRVNPLKITPEELLEKDIFPLMPVPWCREGFYYDGQERPSKHPYYYLGLYYLQEPSAMSPAAMLPIKEGDYVLDLCAAPGGKSTQLGAKLQGTGLLVANDISATRTKALSKNIELFGIRNAVITCEGSEKLVKFFPAFFDKILLDAPCSGEGMFRKDPSVINSWGDKMTAFCIRTQRELLSAAAEMLAPGGMLLYSTCTFAPEEDEGAIAAFLQEHPDFTIVPLPKEAGFAPGRPDWVENGMEELSYCGRLFPHKIKGEGHFLCLLQKAGNRTEKASLSKMEGTAPKADMESYRNFEQEVLSLELAGNFQKVGADLYLLPEGIPDLRGLRVMRCGWHLGQCKKNRFEPYQAFAMGLLPGEAKQAVPLSAADENTIRYLKGETLELDLEGTGFALVTCDGYPMGWGKLQRGNLKNKYFPGWRIV